jgi:hypothetical protein
MAGLSKWLRCQSGHNPSVAAEVRPANQNGVSRVGARRMSEQEKGDLAQTDRLTTDSTNVLNLPYIALYSHAVKTLMASRDRELARPRRRFKRRWKGLNKGDLSTFSPPTTRRGARPHWTTRLPRMCCA